jgi:hypothetical protein
MSCVVSTGESADEIWMVQNAIYRWFIRLASSRCTDEKLLYRLTMSVLTNGISLESVLQEDAAVARRLGMLIRSLAVDVAAGKYALVDDDGHPRSEMQQGAQNACSDLAGMLDAWLARL